MTSLMFTSKCFYQLYVYIYKQNSLNDIYLKVNIFREGNILITIKKIRLFKAAYKMFKTL